MTGPSKSVTKRNDAVGSPDIGSIVAVQAQSASPMAMLDESASQAAISGLYKGEAGKLATEKAHDGRVRSFANQMIIDHTEAQRELIATAGKLKLPAEADQPHEKLLSALKAASAEHFNRLYVDQHVSTQQCSRAVHGLFH